MTKTFARALAALALASLLATGALADETSDWAAIEAKMKERTASREAFVAHWLEVGEMCAAFAETHPESPTAPKALYIAGRQFVSSDPDRALEYLGHESVVRDFPYSHFLRIQIFLAQEKVEEAEAALAALKATEGKAIPETAIARADRAVRRAKGEDVPEPARPGGQRTQSDVVKIGEKPPALAGATYGGGEFDLAELEGKVVLIDFWATWCRPCIAELPNVVAAYEKFHEAGLEVVGVSLDSDENALKNFLAGNEDVEWPQFFDGGGWRNAQAKAYGVKSIPFTVLVGTDGKVIAVSLRGEALHTAIAAALADGDPEEAEAAKAEAAPGAPSLGTRAPGR